MQWLFCLLIASENVHAIIISMLSDVHIHGSNAVTNQYKARLRHKKHMPL